MQIVTTSETDGKKQPLKKQKNTSLKESYLMKTFVVQTLPQIEVLMPLKIKLKQN